MSSSIPTEIASGTAGASEAMHALLPLPGARPLGRFGSFGGRFVPETLMDALNRLTEEYEKAKADPEFQATLNDYLKNYVGRPSPLYLAERLTAIGGRGGDLSQARRPEPHRRPQDQQRDRPGDAGARMGKKRVIAETGAGQHGVATATACALFGLECTVYMGEEDIRRQKLNVFNMRTMGADGGAGDDRIEDPPRRHQRGDARLDGIVEGNALHHRQRGRPAPVSR